MRKNINGVSVPNDWKVSKIEEVITEFQNGYAFSSKGYVQNGIPIISMAMISLDGRFQFDINKHKKWNKNEENSLQRYLLKKGDLIMAMTDVTPNKDLIGRMTIINQGEKYLLNQRVGHLRLQEDVINPSYLSYIGNSESWLRHCRNNASQGAQANIGTQQIKDSFIPLPPLPEQQKIAEILSTADEKIDSIDQRIAETQNLKKGLMQQLLTKGISHTKFKDSPLGEIPESWEISNLESHSHFITKGSTPTTYGYEWQETGIQFLRSECVSPNGFILSGAMHISDEANNAMERSKIKGGDILMTITGNVGRVCIYPMEYKNGNINQHIARIRITDSSLSSQFVFQYLSQALIIQEYLKITTGQAYPQLSLKQVRETKIPLPPIQEQEEIAEILKSVDEKLQIQEDKKTEYQELKKGLMQQLLTGRIRVKT
ncbi:restriction endonuclease subunit S [Aequorivita antarctica]|uniref:Restriction endonuclease subunit S n=1 Tax=Aequorivita antarctica TaxID=153266 RepID=A0A5C6Z1W2_9FLAO|nr:restriction endonuclease subunit S [Aequorivita antarctica]TXD73912.1 restriction endonuclease subunit S [Aequorivita antarctica]SRX73369.1 Type-1 restriction enzyme EcoKI specificity protein [Aequorivita antarctica]